MRRFATLTSTFCLGLACSALTFSGVACTGSQAGAPINRSSASVRGVIRNIHGWELKGLLVMAVSLEGLPTRTGFTDAQGIYLIANLGPGAYTLHVSRRQHVVAKRVVQVAGNAAIDTHFIVPAVFGDRPEERGRPIVNRSLVSTPVE